MNIKKLRAKLELLIKKNKTIDLDQRIEFIDQIMIIEDEIVELHDLLNEVEDHDTSDVDDGFVFKKPKKIKERKRS